MAGNFPIECFKSIDTPFYYYDIDVLNRTLNILKYELSKYNNYSVHYAIKANANPRILQIIRDAGFGADCVSGGEIEVALKMGFDASSIVYAGVGKSDKEINFGLSNNIFCFNVESFQELEVINTLAKKQGRIAQVCFRINPNVDAHTHAHITTGLAENKFGITLENTQSIVQKALALPHIKYLGLHFHIGSQILDMDAFKALCFKINDLQTHLEALGIVTENINVGGGLGINYEHPQENDIPDFKSYFETYSENLILREGQKVHFELGRSLTAQCGSLIARVLYIKKGIERKFMILDAGMTELLRPALYGAHHQIENLSSPYDTTEVYDVVGPICESSDVFGHDVSVLRSDRGDLIALRTAGAYGEVMASQYNCRRLPTSYFSNDFHL